VTVLVVFVAAAGLAAGAGFAAAGVALAVPLQTALLALPGFEQS
jgi:hypothetical protein